LDAAGLEEKAGHVKGLKKRGTAEKRVGATSRGDQGPGGGWVGEK